MTRTHDHPQANGTVVLGCTCQDWPGRVRDVPKARLLRGVPVAGVIAFVISAAMLGVSGGWHLRDYDLRTRTPDPIEPTVWWRTGVSRQLDRLDQRLLELERWEDVHTPRLYCIRYDGNPVVTIRSNGVAEVYGVRTLCEVR